MPHTCILGSGDNFQITACDDACGQKFFTLAFIIADKNGAPAWNGRQLMAENHYASQIKAIRQRGGDVIVSFGGEGGTELALAETNLDALRAKYQTVIDQYQFTWLDFDIEGDSLLNVVANERRNAAIAALQSHNPGLRITYTLPVDPQGISAESRRLLADARARHVRVFSVNVMTMDFGGRFSRGREMSGVSIASALKTREQCQSIDPAIRIGLTPMIGQNDQRGEIFGTKDAAVLKQWCDTQPWICSLSFWSVNRDAGNPPGPRNSNRTSSIIQKPWEFTRLFQPFATSR